MKIEIIMAKTNSTMSKLISMILNLIKLEINTSTPQPMSYLSFELCLYTNQKKIKLIEIFKENKKIAKE